jgi:hypothetical protein
MKVTAQRSTVCDFGSRTVLVVVVVRTAHDL